MNSIIYVKTFLEREGLNQITDLCQLTEHIFVAEVAPDTNGDFFVGQLKQQGKIWLLSKHYVKSRILSENGAIESKNAGFDHHELNRDSLERGIYLINNMDSQIGYAAVLSMDNAQYRLWCIKKWGLNWTRGEGSI